MSQEQQAVLQEAIKKVCENPEFEQDVLALGLEVNYVDGAALKEKISGWVEDLAPRLRGNEVSLISQNKFSVSLIDFAQFAAGPWAPANCVSTKGG